MGTFKRLYLILNNKKRYAKIKAYKFYRKDFWGLLRLKRRFNFKEVIYAFLKSKKKFYKIILYQIFKGVKFFIRKYNYRANLFMVKKRLKFFYFKLNDTQFGKLGKYFQSGKGNVIDYFFSMLERRLDVLLVRSLYFFVIKDSNKYIKNFNVFVNNKLIDKGNFFVKITDIISLRIFPVVQPFFFSSRFITIDFSKGYKKRKKNLKKYFFFLLFFFFFLFIRNFSRKKNRIIKFKNFFFFIKFNILKNLVYKFFKLRYFFTKIYKYFYFFGIFILKFYKYCLRIKKFKYKIKRFKKFKLMKFLIRFFFFFRFFSSIFTYIFFFRYYFFRLPNLNARVKYYRFFHKSRIKWYHGLFFNKIKYFFNKYVKRFRFFQVSRKLYKRLQYKCFFLYSGYPPYLEINYKLHKIILIKNPSTFSVKYPFFVNNFLFFNYFKQKSYF
jgi:ribosomal protein S4